MKQLPNAETYRLEMQFMPWGLLMKKVASAVIRKVPRNGKVLDLMCGPGYLLDSIHTQRPDLVLVGVDSDPRYTSYCTERNSEVCYIEADVHKWNDSKQYSCVLCTGGVHHLPYSDQPQLFVKMAALMKRDGFCICADPCIGEYASESERQLAAAELGYEYLRAVLNNGAPISIINAAIDILRNDVLADGEYKNSPSRLIEMAKEAFGQVKVEKVWPETPIKYGDYYMELS